MKAANILIAKNGTLKLADFGLARAFSMRLSHEKPNRYTNRVVKDQVECGPVSVVWCCWKKIKEQISLIKSKM
jgi:serine/threonine protein kinase